MSDPLIIDGKEYVNLKEAAEILSIRWYRAKPIFWNKAKTSIKSGRIFFLKSDIEKMKKEPWLKELQEKEHLIMEKYNNKKVHDKIKIFCRILKDILNFLKTKGIHKEEDIMFFLMLLRKSNPEQMIVHNDMGNLNTIKRLERHGIITLNLNGSLTITSEVWELMKPYSTPNNK